MLLITIIILAILLISYVSMSTGQVLRVNRAAVAMFSGVIVWLLYMIHGGDFLRLVHAEEYAAFLEGAPSTISTVKEFVATNVITRYISEAWCVILF